MVKREDVLARLNQCKCPDIRRIVRDIIEHKNITITTSDLSFINIWCSKCNEVFTLPVEFED